MKLTDDMLYICAKFWMREWVNEQMNKSMNEWKNLYSMPKCLQIYVFTLPHLAKN